MELKRSNGGTLLCLNKISKKKGGTHFIKDCSNIDKGMKQERLKGCIESQRAHIESSPAVTQSGSSKWQSNFTAKQLYNTSQHHFVLFEVAFTWRKVITSNGWSATDTILQLAQTFEDIRKHFSNLSTYNLNLPNLYRAIPGGQFITCQKSASLNLHLKVRHSSSLLLRNEMCSIPRENLSLHDIRSKSTWVYSLW